MHRGWIALLLFVAALVIRSTGWLAALAMRLRARTGTKKNEPKIAIRGVQNESSNCRITS